MRDEHRQHKAVPTTITGQPSGGRAAGGITDRPPSPTGTPDVSRSLFRIALAVLATPLLILGGLAAWLMRDIPGAPPVVRVAQEAEAELAFAPTSPEDLLVDKFMGLVNSCGRVVPGVTTGGPAGKHLLGPAAAFDEQPISEAEANVRIADFYLRHPNLGVVSIRRGEVVGGKKVQTAGRYTLVTKVQGNTPPFRTRDEAGKVEPPSRMFMINPDIVVDVKGGKIHPVRAELHND